MHVAGSESRVGWRLHGQLKCCRPCRWGRSENMPFMGPKKGALLQRLVKDRKPLLAVEVGTMAGEQLAAGEKDSYGPRGSDWGG